MHCYEHECQNPTGEPCHYVDRDGRRCLSAWCDKHRVVVEEQVFCRRHAGIMTSIVEGKLVAPLLPGLDNRCPSLLVWMSDQIGPELESHLAGLGSVESTPTQQPEGVPGRWDKVWIVSDGESTVARVSLEIQEPEPEVIARVNGAQVASGVPPWVMHRGRLEWVPPDVDAAERKEFNALLLDAFRSRLQTTSVRDDLDSSGPEQNDEDAGEDAAHHG